MMRLRVLLLLLLMFSAPVFSQKTVAKTNVFEEKQPEISADSLMRVQSTMLPAKTQRNFVQDFRRKYTSPEFDYSASKPRETLWDRWKRKIAEFFDRLFTKQVNDFNDRSETLLHFLAGILFLVLVYFLVKYVVSNDGSFIFSRKNRKTKIPAEDLIEDIHAINFPAEIAKFEQNADFRSAVRMRFLQLLKMMDERKIIAWQPEKTNQEYLAELKNSEFKKQFKSLARVYDYVWYGEFPVSEKDYQGYRTNFENAHRRI